MTSHCNNSRWQRLKKQLRNLSPEEFREALEQWPQARLMDVRTREEYDSGHLSGALHLDYLGEEFLDEFDRLDRNITWLVYCRTGRRSLRVCTLMRNAGFTQVYQLDGGLAEAKEALELEP